MFRLFLLLTLFKLHLSQHITINKTLNVFRCKVKNPSKQANVTYKVEKVFGLYLVIPTYQPKVAARNV